jgi:hypothetical protein
MGYVKNGLKEQFWTFVIYVKNRLASLIIVFLMINSEMNSKIRTTKSLKNGKIVLRFFLNMHFIENCLLRSPNILNFLINFNMSKTTSYIFERGSFAQNFKSSIQPFYKF